MRSKTDQRISGMLAITALLLVMLLSTVSVRAAGNVVEVSLGDGHTAALLSDGSLWTWGGNWYGQLGNGTTEDSLMPVKIMNDVAQVSLGANHSAALKKDGSLWVWGDNTDWQVKDGDPLEDFHTPVKIMDNVAQVSLGYQHSAALKTDGSLWTWGSDGRDVNVGFAPVKVMDGVVQVALGGWRTAAIKADGSLWFWGTENDGFLPTVPTKLMDDVAKVALGQYNGAAIKKDGSLWVWGDMVYGQLADALEPSIAQNYINTPVKVMDNVAQVFLGIGHCVALKTDGSLWTWGLNVFGELGYYTEDRYSSVPTRIMDGVARLARTWGAEHTAVIKNDGSLWMWGNNAYGQLGDGTTVSRAVPMQVALKNVRTWTVTFQDGSRIVERQEVEDGKAAVAPRLTKEGYTLSWDRSFSNVTQDITVKAVWKAVVPEKGLTRIVGGVKYKVTKYAKKNGTVQITGVSNKKKTSYSIPQTIKIKGYSFKVTGIAGNTFKGCKKAKKITLPKTITSVGKNAFANVSPKLKIMVPKAKYSKISSLIRKSGISKKVKIKKK